MDNKIILKNNFYKDVAGLIRALKENKYMNFPDDKTLLDNIMMEKSNILKILNKEKISFSNIVTFKIINELNIEDSDEDLVNKYLNKISDKIINLKEKYPETNKFKIILITNIRKWAFHSKNDENLFRDISKKFDFSFCDNEFYDKIEINDDYFNNYLKIIKSIKDNKTISLSVDISGRTIDYIFDHLNYFVNPFFGFFFN